MKDLQQEPSSRYNDEKGTTAKHFVGTGECVSSSGTSLTYFTVKVELFHPGL